MILSFVFRLSPALRVNDAGSGATATLVVLQGEFQSVKGSFHRIVNKKQIL